VRRLAEHTARRLRTRREGVREGLTVVIASIVAFAAGATALSLLRGGDYEATAVVTRAPAGEPARSPEAARRALATAGAERASARELLERLEAERRSGGRLALTVRADESAAARRLAGSYARAWVESLPGGVGARAGVAGPARRDRDILGDALGGAAVGLLAGLLLAVLREALDVRRTSSRSVTARLGLEELGRVPEAPVGLDEAYRLPVLEAPQGAAASAYAELGARVAEEAETAAAARVILVCGTVTEDRGEQVAAGLGAALAGGGRRVAVVELDPARPTLRRQFALPRGAGAAEVARGDSTLGDALTPVQGASGLCVLAAGEGPPAGNGAHGAVLDALRERFDVVVVAGAPLLRDGEPHLVGVDGLVLAVGLRRTRHSRRPRLERVLDALDVPVLGFVLTTSPSVGARLSAPRA
jgi:Mrp family chromosome partitioning ATPase